MNIEKIFIYFGLIVFICGIGYFVYLTFSINSSHEQLFKIKMAMIFTERESCKIQCNEDNMSFTSIDFDTRRCFCANENREIKQYKIKINPDAEKKYFEHLLE